MIVCGVRLYCDCLRRSLNQRRVDVLGTPNGAAAALDMLGLVRPQVILLDMHVPGAAELIPALLARAPETKVVAFGMEEEPHAVLESIEAGAAGYLACEASLDDLAGALAAAARGEVLCSPRIAGSPAACGPNSPP